MFLLLVFALLFVVLGVAIYVVALFFQSYIYTQPTPGLAWRAPASAGVMAVFFTLWCFVITRSDAVPGKLPYDTLFRFSPKVEMSSEPAAKVWAIREDGAKVSFTSKKGDDLRAEYLDDRRKPWIRSGVVAVEIDNKGNKIRLDAGEYNEGGYRLFTSDDGWVMQEFENGPTGVPSQSRWGRFLSNLAFNMLHAGLWFVCLWLLLQFRFNDALGFTFVIWLFMTVGILPMLLDRSAEVARDRNATTTG